MGTTNTQTSCFNSEVQISTMASHNPAFKSSQDSCNEVLRALRGSSWVFLVSKSPYSIQICFKKCFIKDALTVKLRNEHAIKEDQCGTLVEALVEVNKALQSSNHGHEIVYKKKA